MGIKARKLREGNIPEPTALYEVNDSQNIIVEEKQDDGSLDQVVLEYQLTKDEAGYFAKEYRPEGIPKEGAKKIDITAIVQSQKAKSVRWHLYDIKDTLAGENTVIKLYAQWNAGLQYLRKSILNHMPEYREESDLGVITRRYDKKRMEKLKEHYEHHCEDAKNDSDGRTLARRKSGINIPKYRGILKATQSILDERFQPEDEAVTYEIHIKRLEEKPEGHYKLRFPV